MLDQFVFVKPHLPMRGTILVVVALLVMSAFACAGAPSRVNLPTDATAPATEAAVQLSETSSPEEVVPRATPTPQLTSIENLGRTGTAIVVDIATYRLVVDGLVEQPLYISYDQLLAYPAVTQVPRLECPGFFVNYAEWTGPLVRTLLEQAGIRPGASKVEFSDGSEYPYQATLSPEEALRDDTFLATHVYGQVLPIEHGYPVRLVVGSKLGSAWVKWLFHIEVK